MAKKIQDLERRANGTIESFNVDGVFVAPGYPYTHVTAVHRTSGYDLSLSGMLGLDEHGKLVGENVYKQTMQAIVNICTVLEAVCGHFYSHAVTSLPFRIS